MYKTIEGLVLRRTRFSDSHAYVRILTNEGIITFLAHGIMSPKNKNSISCQPYTYSEFVLKVSGESCSLSSATTLRHMIKQGVDFERLSLSNYVVSMANDTAFDVTDAPEILALTCTALKVIDSTDTPSDIIKAVFELRLMAGLGFLPDLDGCLKCGKSNGEGFFLFEEGGFVCQDCHIDETRRAVRVDGELMGALRLLFEMPLKNAFGIRFSDPVKKNAFITLAERFSLEHLDCAGDALNFYKENIKNF
ncbi:MAG: DNA repair protein RecO [Clostridia bacterium]|nr:DNA repair protein RecO [Clostridia bacterium]